MKHRHALLALLLTAVLGLGGFAAAQALAAAPTAACTASPAVVDGGTTQNVTVTCKVPKPPSVTVTSTATATVTATVTASPSPSGSASATPTPSPTPTPTPTATATSTPSSPPSSFPDATNTGVPAGTALTAYTGPSVITTAGTVIDGKTLGCIEVAAPNVTIRNSRISCAGSPVYVDDRTSTATVLTLTDVEIDCKNTGGTAIGEADVTVRRANIHGCENGFDVNQNVTVEDSYIHDMYNTGASHTDGMQLAGHWNGSAYVGGALNVTIRHNTIYGVGADGSLGTSAVISNRSGDVNVLVENNLLGGGAFTLYCDGDTSEVNFQVLGNHFTKRFSGSYGAYGPSDGCGNVTQSGNVDHETGTALHLD